LLKWLAIARHDTHSKVMLVKSFIIVMLIAMLISLFSALYFMFTDRGKGTRTVKALSFRIGIWVFLLLFLALGTATGILKPINSIVPPVSQAPAPHGG
jgi:hypothetical protein